MNREQLTQRLMLRLDRFDAELRCAATLDGTAVWLLVALSLGWMTLAADAMWEWSLGVRVFQLLAVTVLLTWDLWRQLLRWWYPAAWASWSHVTLATIVERRFPQINGTLLTALECRAASPNLFDEHIATEAIAVLEQCPPRSLVAWHNVALRLLLVFFMLGVTLLFVARFQAVASVWCERNVFLHDRPWSHAAAFVVDGVDSTRTLYHVRGEPCVLVIRTVPLLGRLPSSVRLGFISATGATTSRVIDHFEIDSRDGRQDRVFVMRLDTVVESFSFTVNTTNAAAGADQWRVEVVERPSLAASEVTLTYPDYLDRVQQRLAFYGGSLAVPFATHITLAARANRAVHTTAMLNSQHSNIKHCDLGFGTDIAFAVGELRREITLQLELTDEHNIASEPPIRMSWSVVPDQPPVVAASLVGMGGAITPHATLSVDGNITDDHALQNIAFCYTADNAAGQVPIAAALYRAEYRLGENSGASFDAEPLGLREGDTLELWVEASDTCNLDPNQPNGQVGSSTRWRLSVVSPEQLQAMLAAQEIALRQRLDAIRSEAMHTQETLTQETTQDSIIRERWIRDAQKQRYELQTLRTSLQQIQQQRQHNAMSDEATEQRFDSTSQRLSDLVDRQYPEAEEAFRAQHNDTSDTSTRERWDSIVADLTVIRDQMLAMETYQEIVGRLRAVLQLQQTVRSDTQQEQRHALRRIAIEPTGEE